MQSYKTQQRHQKADDDINKIASDFVQKVLKQYQDVDDELTKTLCNIKKLTAEIDSTNNIFRSGWLVRNQHTIFDYIKTVPGSR